MLLGACYAYDQNNAFWGNVSEFGLAVDNQLSASRWWVEVVEADLVRSIRDGMAPEELHDLMLKGARVGLDSAAKLVLEADFSHVS
jgi:hypothetical protein